MVNLKRTKGLPTKNKFTDPYVRSLKPGPKTTMVWDTKQGGLALSVTRNGVKSFKVAYRHQGRLRWYTIDRYPNVGIAEARNTARQIRARAALGDDPQGEKVAKRQGDTLRVVAALYVERVAKKNNKSWKHTETLIKHHVLPVLGSRKLTDLKRGDLRRLFENITARGSPITANQVLASVSAVLTWAVNQEMVPDNVARGITRNKTKAGERFLSQEEIALVWPAVGDLGFHGALALRLILATAQRPGEVCGARWQDVDLQGALWTLPGAPEGNWRGTKNGRTHEVPLSSLALDLLAELDRQEVGPVFPSARRSHITIPDARSIWKALEIPRFRPHDLRATAATGMDELGIHKEQIAQVLNHKDGSVTASYVRSAHREQKRHALDAWGARLSAIVEGREATASVVPLRSA